MSDAARTVLSAAESDAAARFEIDAIASLARAGSLELVAGQDAAALVGVLPAGSEILISQPRGRGIAPSLFSVRQVRAAGFAPVPHIIARNLASKAELAVWLAALREQGVRRVLVSGGDAAPGGPYDSARDVLAAADLAACGVTDVLVAGHPEGHPRLGRAALDADLRDKQRLVRAQGLGFGVLTQFAFQPAPLLAWCERVRGLLGPAELRIGVAAPAQPAQLLRHGLRCGVGASIHGLTVRGGLIGRRFGARGPEDIVRPLARAMALCQLDLAGLHVFTLGEAGTGAAWLAGAQAGRIRLCQDRDEFRVLSA